MPNKYGTNLPIKMHSQTAAAARDKADADQKKAALDKAMANTLLNTAKNYKGAATKDLVDRDILGNKKRSNGPKYPGRARPVL